MTKLGLKNGVVLALAAGLTGAAADAGIAHFAGGALKHPGQLLPVIFGATGLLLVLAVFRASAGWFRRLVRTVGAGSIAIGLIGTAYHGAALARLLTGGGHFDAGLLGTALTVAPPVMAPGAFVVIGIALWALSSPRVRLTLRDAGPKTADAAA